MLSFFPPIRRSFFISCCSSFYLSVSLNNSTRKISSCQGYVEIHDVPHNHKPLPSLSFLSLRDCLLLTFVANSGFEGQFFLSSHLNYWDFFVNFITTKNQSILYFFFFKVVVVYCWIQGKNCSTSGKKNKKKTKEWLYGAVNFIYTIFLM